MCVGSHRARPFYKRVNARAGCDPTCRLLNAPSLEGGREGGRAGGPQIRTSVHSNKNYSGLCGRLNVRVAREREMRESFLPLYI